MSIRDEMMSGRLYDASNEELLGGGVIFVHTVPSLVHTNGCTHVFFFCVESVCLFYHESKQGIW